MRHIDHSHQTESNREAKRNHQQNRAEAQPVENGAIEIDPFDVFLNGGHRAFCFAEERRAGVRVFCHVLEILQAANGIQSREFLDGGNLSRKVGAAELKQRDGFLQ